MALWDHDPEVYAAHVKVADCEAATNDAITELGRAIGRWTQRHPRCTHREHAPDCSERST